MLYGELPVVTLEGGEQVQGVAIRLEPSGRTAVVRLPTENEMITLLSKRRTIRKNLGRGRLSTTRQRSPDADIEMFKAIRIDRGPDRFDADELRSIIDSVTDYEPVECKREGEGYRISLNTPFGDTVHYVAKPSRTELSQCWASCYSVRKLNGGLEALRLIVEPIISLYDSIVRSIEGYAAGIEPNDVPPHHKWAIVIAVADAEAK